jgi:hypothetical protein
MQSTDSRRGRITDLLRTFAKVFSVTLYIIRNYVNFSLFFLLTVFYFALSDVFYVWLKDLTYLKPAAKAKKQAKIEHFDAFLRKFDVQKPI